MKPPTFAVRLQRAVFGKRNEKGARAVQTSIEENSDGGGDSNGTFEVTFAVP